MSATDDFQQFVDQVKAALNQFVTGNPAPSNRGKGRAGDNLYSNSLLALNADTCKLNWYFQYTPNDMWDYDAVSPVVFFDVVDGNNDVYDLGCCQAEHGYDTASGLGAIRFDELADHGGHVEGGVEDHAVGDQGIELDDLLLLGGVVALDDVAAEAKPLREPVEGLGLVLCRGDLLAQVCLGDVAQEGDGADDPAHLTEGLVDVVLAGLVAQAAQQVAVAPPPHGGNKTSTRAPAFPPARRHRYDRSADGGARRRAS